MISRLDKLIETSPDPQTAGLRMERMYEDGDARAEVEKLSESKLSDLVRIISLSNFLHRFLCRYPKMVHSLGERQITLDTEVQDIQALRIYKYQELLKLTWLDISQSGEYQEVLSGLSILADSIVRQTINLSSDEESRKLIDKGLSVFALGKLGASELNYSSDIDLILVSANHYDLDIGIDRFQSMLTNTIRKVVRTLEDKTADGFLYRVDLKLRPWGASGPLFMSVDETENYYEASSEAWERLAWLRARVIAGCSGLGQNFLERINPFVFRRSLSTEDLERFLQIKNDMSRARKRSGHWNVKVGEGGIRDLEFFIQILQIVNAGRYKELQTTNTLTTLSGLTRAGLINNEEETEIRHSYLFLRRLENRLQMMDEQQTHELPDDKKVRLIIARSLDGSGESDDQVLDNFENELFVNRTIAKNYFERILPESSA